MRGVDYMCRVMVTELPVDARGPACRLRWWQPVHSGAGRGVWALDDVTVADFVHNMLWVDFADHDSTTRAVSVHHGTIGAHCGRPKVLL